MKFKPQGVCSQEIDVEIKNDIVVSVKFKGGCAGNTFGISKLVEGMKVDDVIEKLHGVKCGFKSTSCPDQLSLALMQAKQENN